MAHAHIIIHADFTITPRMAVIARICAEAGVHAAAHRLPFQRVVELAFNSWASEDTRTGIDSMGRDEFRAEVKQQLRHLGLMDG